VREQSIPVTYMRRPRRRTQWPRAFKSLPLHGCFLTKSGHNAAVPADSRLPWALAFREFSEGPEILAVHTRTISDLKLRDALIVGIAQVGALIPGVSRSGSTLTAALCLDLKRDEAARFSFLLGLPAIALAGLKELWTLHGAGLSPYGWSILVFGLLIASISAFFAIWGLMRFLEHFSTWPFVVYRFLLGVLLLMLAIRGYGVG